MSSPAEQLLLLFSTESAAQIYFDRRSLHEINWKTKKGGAGRKRSRIFSSPPTPLFWTVNLPLGIIFETRRISLSVSTSKSFARQNTSALQATKSPNFNRRLYSKGEFVPTAPPPSPRPFLPSIRTSGKFCDLAEQYLRTLLTITFKLKFPNFQFGKWSLP